MVPNAKSDVDPPQPGSQRTPRVCATQIGVTVDLRAAQANARLAATSSPTFRTAIVGAMSMSNFVTVTPNQVLTVGSYSWSRTAPGTISRRNTVRQPGPTQPTYLLRCASPDVPPSAPLPPRARSNKTRHPPLPTNNIPPIHPPLFLPISRQIPLFPHRLYQIRNDAIIPNLP
jgi:hypothetical protein